MKFCETLNEKMTAWYMEFSKNFYTSKKPREGEGERERDNPLPHPSFSHLFAPSPQSATQSERLEQTCLLINMCMVITMPAVPTARL